MDEARAVVAEFCEKNPYLLGALPMTWFGCGPFARMVVAGVIYELRLVITRALAIADREDNKKYVELVCDTYRHWPVRVLLWGLLMVMFLMPFIYMVFNHDNDIVYYGWRVIYTTMCIFVALWTFLSFHAIEHALLPHSVSFIVLSVLYLTDWVQYGAG